MDEKADPTNPVLLETLELLKREEAPVWNSVREKLGKVNRKRAEVNLSDIERAAKDGETVVVPGKVLGSGKLEKEIDVAAFKVSGGARKEIEEKGDFMFIQELVTENPEGENVRIVS